MEPLATVGRSTLYAADVIDFLRGYDGRQFDVTVTSPPYGLGKEYEGVDDTWARDDYFGWVEMWAASLYDQTSEHGRVCVNVPLDVNLGGHLFFASEFHTSMIAAGWEFQSQIIWDKGVINNKTAYGSWMSANSPNVMTPAEIVLVYNREGWNRSRPKGPSDITKEHFMEWRTTIWSIPGAKASKLGHPAPFPLELPKRLIQLFSFKDDLILDVFAGSGTTLEAAELLGRESVGVDLVERYLKDLAIPRIEAARDVREGALTQGQERLVNAPLPTAS